MIYPPFFRERENECEQTFLKLLQRHLPKLHPIHKIFNHNTIKISNCCMRNMETVISSHNKQILNPSKEYFRCNYRVPNECLLDNKCLTPNIVYEAKVSNETNNEYKKYLGGSETQFKERSRNQTRDFKHKKYEKCTELSKCIWNLKAHGITPVVKWSIVKNVNSKTTGNYCKLCLTEKFSIIQSLDHKNVLNKKSELVNKYRHQNKLLLSNVKRKDTMDWENCILYFVFCMCTVVCWKVSFCWDPCRLGTSQLICYANELPVFCMQWFPSWRYCRANFSISVFDSFR